jgi:hypothetical protein
MVASVVSQNQREISMYYAARSGSREMCEHMRKINDGQVLISQLLTGAIESGSMELCSFARELIEKCADLSEIDRAQGQFISWIPSDQPRANQIAQVARYAMEHSARCGNRALCEYFRAWYKECVKRTAHHDKAETLRMITKSATSAVAWMLRVGMHPARDRVRPVELSYDGVFMASIHSGAYWIASLAFEWSEEDDIECDLTLMRKYSCSAGALNIVIAAMRGQFARILRRDLAKQSQDEARK